jgi:hypothetical protein
MTGESSILTGLTGSFGFLFFPFFQMKKGNINSRPMAGRKTET